MMQPDGGPASLVSPNPENKLFVGGAPPGTDEQTLQQARAPTLKHPKNHPHPLPGESACRRRRLHGSRGASPTVSAYYPPAAHMPFCF